MSETNRNISEIRAEVLLNQLYPQLSDSWLVRNKGSFYRNYSEDVLQLDENSCEASLSRDGFLRLLPQGIISEEDELLGKDFQSKAEALRERKKLLEELFIPIDSWRFRDSVNNEQELASLLEDKLNLILKTYYGVDIQEEENPYVREFMKLLPKANTLRGDFYKIADILSVLLNRRVTTEISSYNWTDKTTDTQPMVSYKVWIPSLDEAEYLEFEKHINALTAFVVEWFIPFNTHCLIEIKTDVSSSLNNKLLLNYNTKLSLLSK